MRLSTLLYTALIVCVTFLLSCNSNYLEPKTISSQELQKDPSFKYVSKKVFEDNMILLDRVKTLNITDLNSTLARDSIVALLESDEQAFDAFSVELKGPQDIHCPQGVYRFSHQAFGTAELLLTPHAADSYHICISRKKAVS